MKIKLLIRNCLLGFPFIGTYLKFRTIPSYNKSFLSYVWFWIKLDKKIYWPQEKGHKVTNAENIILGYNSAVGSSGTYLQGIGQLIIGNNVSFARNIGVISANHSIYNQSLHDAKTTIIGDYSWIGMNAVILPGVTLGPRTIVGAGSVVTKSFSEGYCVIAGNPARKIKDIDRKQFKPYDFEYHFYGYIPVEKFDKFKQKYLSY